MARSQPMGARAPLAWLLLAVLAGSAAARTALTLGRELQGDDDGAGNTTPSSPAPPLGPIILSVPPSTPVDLSFLGALPPTGCDPSYLGVPIQLPADPANPTGAARIRLACPGGEYAGRPFDIESAARMVCRNIACSWWEVQFYTQTDSAGKPIDLLDVQDYGGTNWFDVKVGDPSLGPTPTVYVYLVPDRDEVQVTVIDITSGKRTPNQVYVPAYATTADIKNEIYKKNGVYPQHQRLFLLDNGQPYDSENALYSPITLSGELSDYALVGKDDLAAATGAEKRKYRVPVILLVRTFILGHSIHLSNMG